MYQEDKHDEPRFEAGNYVNLLGAYGRLVKVVEVLPVVHGVRWYKVEIDHQSGTVIRVREDDLRALSG